MPHPTPLNIGPAGADGPAGAPGPSGADEWTLSMYGTGADGVVDLNGVNTFSYMSKVGNVYTLMRDMRATDVTVRAGCTLVKRYILYARGTLVVEATGVIHDNGASTVNVSAGGATGPGTRRPESLGVAGAAGRTTTIAGNGGIASSNSYGAASGSGGSSGMGQAGGAGVAAALPAGTLDTLRGPGYLSTLLLQGGTTWAAANGGSGGGSGGINITLGGGESGGGGGGAPVSALFARVIENAGSITNNGGAGGNAFSMVAGAGGGGGGGGGGYLIIVTDSELPLGGTVTSNGGLGGSGYNGGTNGTNGANGTVDYRRSS